jgi:hypothetical protein
MYVGKWSVRVRIAARLRFALGSGNEGGFGVFLSAGEGFEGGLAGAAGALVRPGGVSCVGGWDLGAVAASLRLSVGSLLQKPIGEFT